MTVTPLVSICCITYNHEKYIRDAIEGFLMQKTDFPIEIIIHDDASTDKTQDIIREYAEKDERLIPILRKINIKSTGVHIFPFTFEKARGKYLALCEGDDYWTDPLKLQKQVDILERHPHLAMVTHEANHQSTLTDNDKTFRRFVSIFYRDYQLYGWKRIKELGYMYFKCQDKFWRQKRTADAIKRKKISFLNDFSDNTWYMPMCSIFMKKEVIDPLPDCYAKTDGGHQFTLLLGAMKGGIFHIPEIMAVKKDQETSISKNKERKKWIAIRDKIPEKSNRVKRYECLKNIANQEQKLILDQMIKNYISSEKSKR